MSEWEDVQKLFVSENTCAEEICRVRTEYAMEWYIRKANWNKWVFYILTSISIVCPVLNAIVTIACEAKIVLVILASITTLATSILGMTNAQMKWDNYRTAAEFLKAEYTLFQAKVEPYHSSARASVYLKNIEEFMKQTHVKWEKGFKKNNENDEEDKPKKNNVENEDNKNRES